MSVYEGWRRALASQSKSRPTGLNVIVSTVGKIDAL